VQVDPIVQKENIQHVHHYLAHISNNETASQYPRPRDCFEFAGSTDYSGLLSAWAAGGGSTILPPDAAFPMGKREGSIQYIVLELHYNNPNGVGGYTDQSGLRLWYTTVPRKYEADVLVLGDPGVNFHPIPALSFTEYEAECPSVCTASLPHPITVFLSFPHMHQVGTEIWTTQWRNGTQIAEWGRVEFWSFDHQQQEIINFTLQPGDRLNTHCIFDTSYKNTPTPFGLSSADEMCMHFLSYYPRITIPTNNANFHYCGFADPEYTFCGDESHYEDSILSYPNPSIYDPSGGGNRTFGETPSTPKVCQPTPGSGRDDISAAPRSTSPILPLLLFLSLVFFSVCLL